MSNPTGKWHILGAAVIFAAGAAVAAVGGAQLYGKMGAVAEQQILLTKVRELALSEETIASARIALNTADVGTPANIDSLLTEAGLDQNVSDSREAVIDMGGGWSVLTREITISDVVLTDLDQFLASCQKGRPPWVAVNISLRSSPFESGRAQAVLKMQALRSQKK